MTFNVYLKLCRTNLDFTQKELVLELYTFDTIFDGLDVNTLGRWERAVTKTPLMKQKKILNYFFDKVDFYFPFLEINDIKSIENAFSPEKVYKLLGKHKQLVMSFPTNHASKNDFTVKYSQESQYLQTAFSTAINICDDMYGTSMFYTPKQLEEFTTIESSLFLVCEYKEQYFGHAFFLYLKPDIYEKIMRFEYDYLEITSNDLAQKGEKGSYFSTGLFAMNEKAIALLFVRVYAHLILEQKKVMKIGTLISDNDAVNIAKNFGLQKRYKKDNLIAYDAKIKEVLLTEQIIKMLF